MRARRSGYLQEVSVFCTQQGSCTYELIRVETTCTRPVIPQECKNSHTETGGRWGHKVLPLAEELLAIDSFQERRGKVSFLKSMWLQVD